jgi:hypothetical protein
MAQDKAIRIKRKSWVKHSRPRPRWVDLLPFLAFGLCCLAGLAYFVYCCLTTPDPLIPHPSISASAKAKAPAPAHDHTLVNSK